MAVAREKQRADIIGKGQIPDDVGLMQGTFIMPFGKNLPGWFGDFKGRWKLEKKRAWTRPFEWGQNLWFRYYAVQPRPRLEWRRASALATRLHKEMYQSFAAGDLGPVEGQICTGLLSSLRSRIAQRPANTHLIWRLHKYLSAPRLVSFRAGIMPGVDGKMVKDKGAQNGFIQAVVRIHSLQSLQHVRTTTTRIRGKTYEETTLVDAQGREIPADEDATALARKNAKETVEYFVIQKQLKRSKEGSWMVWGTAEETSLEKVEQEGQQRMREKAHKKLMAKAEKGQKPASA